MLLWNLSVVKMNAFIRKLLKKPLYNNFTLPLYIQNSTNKLYGFITKSSYHIKIYPLFLLMILNPIVQDLWPHDSNYSNPCHIHCCLKFLSACKLNYWQIYQTKLSCSFQNLYIAFVKNFYFNNFILNCVMLNSNIFKLGNYFCYNVLLMLPVMKCLHVSTKILLLFFQV